ncbi:MAG: DUF397 domain-containing protein [Pseudonocardiaceae bacterium]
MDDLTHAAWRKSSRSSDHGECVEVADLDGGRRAVRDSKHTTGGPALIFTPVEWTSFVAGVKDGEFD